MSHGNYATIIKTYRWDELCAKHDDLLKDGETVVFRGHKNQKWDLLTSLDRFSRLKKCDIQEIENNFLSEFQRRYHNYSSTIPEIDYRIAWWALMQHYGTPTRLLDFTYSFYVALFFALEDLDSKGNAAVWAIKAKSLDDNLRLRHFQLWKNIKDDQYLEDEKNFEEFNSRSIVIRMNPFLLHERLSVQQGCFLVSGNISQPFIENLIKLYGSEKQLKRYLFKFEIINKGNFRKEILEDLYRMNISHASLFPGLSGFAASLKTIAYAVPRELV